MTKTKKFVVLLFIGGLCLRVGSSSRSSLASQEAAPLQKPLHHEVSVIWKLVQVYVTDKKGKPVPDLQKSDFVVYDNGQKKEIADFERHILTKPAGKVEPKPTEKIVPTEIPPAD
jgi:hypothetical protein